MKNIIFLCPAEKSPFGGAKIIYQYSSLIKTFKNYDSCVIHLKKKKSSKFFKSIKKRLNLEKIDSNGLHSNEIRVVKNFRYKWFNNKIKIKNDLKFNSKKDFVIIPEIYSQLSDIFILKKIPYAVFVQNGYSLFSTNNSKLLKNSYKNAKYLISYSKDIDNCIKLLFPQFSKKIVRVKCSINEKKINIKAKKNNWITYMPRKLPVHSNLVINFLKNKLSKKWIFKSLNNLDESQVFNQLSKSKIFLSFSDLEGLGLPPIEAAIAGNKVIGYTGEAGKEFWKKPIFSSIPNGNIKKFCKTVMKEVNNKDFLIKTQKARKKIANNFSFNNEKKSIINFMNKVKKIK